jgi:hypothetical protein
MTDHTPITVPAPFRPVQIATVHSAAVFLAENPALPMPASVELSAHVTTLELLHIIAAAEQVDIVEQGQWVWCTIPVAIETLHGMAINYKVFYRHPDTTPMDLPPRGQGVTTDPWADMEATHWRPRCTAMWEGARCVHPANHPDSTPHFYDDDETNGAHGA